MKHRFHLILFPPTGPLEFIAVDIPGPLSRKKNGNRFVVIVNGRYSKIMRALPTTEI